MIKYIPGNVYDKTEEVFIKIEKIRVCWGYNQVETFLIYIIMRYKRAISNVKYVQDNCGMICQQKYSY